MLLFKPDEVVKPITEIQVGESFTVTVTEEDWDRAKRELDALLRSRDIFGSRSQVCPIAQAVLRRGAEWKGEWDGIESRTADFNHAQFAHDSERLVARFDGHGGRDTGTFPGETVVTFTRQG